MSYFEDMLHLIRYLASRNRSIDSTTHYSYAVTHGQTFWLKVLNINENSFFKSKPVHI